MKGFDYAAPRSVGEALGILSEYRGGARILGGGTDLVVAMRNRLTTPQMLVSVKNIAELRQITLDEARGLSIGAAVTLDEIETAAAVREQFPTLAQAAGAVASWQVRHRATIGGNLALNSRCCYYNQSAFWRKAYPDCRKTGGDTCYMIKGGERCYAVFSADTVPALIALDAQVAVRGPQGQERMPLADLYTATGTTTTVLHADQLIATVTVPFVQGRKAFFRKYQDRPSIDFALVTIGASAVQAANGGWQEPRIVLGGVDSGPLRLSEAEALWQRMADEGKVEADRVANAVAKEARIFNTYNGSAIYKRKVIHELAREAVQAICAAGA